MLYVRCCRWLLVSKHLVQENEEFLVGPNASQANFEIFSQDPQNYVKVMESDEVARRTGLPYEKVQDYMMGTILQENGQLYPGVVEF